MPGTQVVIKMEWIKCELSKCYRIPTQEHYVFWLTYFLEACDKGKAFLAVEKFTSMTMTNVVSDSVSV